MRNCASGMQALDSAISNIRAGRSDLVLAGGVDALSRAPLLVSDAMVLWLSSWYAAKTLPQRAQLLTKLKLGYLAPVIGIMKGLTDPMVGLLMGQTAENLAFRFGITRREMDEFSARSHRRVLAAQRSGHFDGEIVPLYDKRGQLYAADDGVRADSTVDNLAKLRPFFDRKYGNVTAGNSSQITDGAAWLVLASERAVSRYGLTPRGRIADSEWAGLDPAQMGLGPVHAATPILRRHGLGLNDVDAWEINEAFAAQVIACERAWNDARYCKEELGQDAPLGQLDEAKLNVDGGAIALGHPVGASGARIVLHVLNVLERTGGRRGIATICIGGGQGGAMLIERADDDHPGLPMRHWTLTRDADGFARLVFDKADATANTLSARGARRAQRGAVGTRPRSAQGPRDCLGQGQRLHRRRRRRRIPRRARRRRRDRDRQARLGHVRASGRGAVSDRRAGSRLLPGRRSRAGARLPVSRRRRRTRHAPRPAGSDAGHRAGVGRHPAPAATDRRAGGVRPAADRPDHRRAQGEAPGHRRRMRAGAGDGERRARRAGGEAGAALASVSAVADARIRWCGRSSRRRQGRPSQGARGASITPRRTPFSSCG